MAFHAGLSKGLSLGDWIPSDATPEFAKLSVRNDTTSTTNDTINLFIDGEYSDFGYAASIVTACADQTVYALRCTSAPAGVVGSATCGPSASTFLMTEGPSMYRISTSTSGTYDGSEVHATLAETCKLSGTTVAVCTATVTGTVGGQSTGTTTQATLSGYDYYRYDVSITGGASQTVSPAATCSPTGSSAAPARVNLRGVALSALVAATAVLGICAI
ncbi:hypothetical protein BX600DRAFT_439068 [Xylariales sp. PMI_506]|nr:hypothetical protein BX600DRAFT_439068 [Xylariales sp. PMI_506]